MYNLVLFLHIIVVICLLIVILIQRGRSGGLIEALGGVESIFGTKTSSFLVKLTVSLATLFFITTITLAYLSKERSKPLMQKYKTVIEEKMDEIQTQQTTSQENEKSSKENEKQNTSDEK